MSARPEPPALDELGRYRQHGKIVYSVVGAYVFLFLLVALILGPEGATAVVWVPILIEALIVLLIVRFLSTAYSIDDRELRARRVLGGRRILLEEVRRIEYARLRDLVATPGFAGVGAWGWRGRMWSPVIGEFDSIYTDAAHGLLVTAGAYPLYISPRDPTAFARELSRRVRSYTGPLAVDVGGPSQ